MSCSNTEGLGSGLFAMDTVVDATLPVFDLPAAPAADRAPRRPAHGSLHIVESDVDGIVINRSDGGLLAAFWGRVRVGDSITLVIRVGGHEAAFAAEVRWCRPCSDGWLAGLRIDAPEDLVPLRSSRRTAEPLLLERLAS